MFVLHHDFRMMKRTTDLMKMVMFLLLLRVASTNLAKKELNKRKSQAYLSMCVIVGVSACLVQSVGLRLHKVTLLRRVQDKYKFGFMVLLQGDKQNRD